MPKQNKNTVPKYCCLLDGNLEEKIDFQNKPSSFICAKFIYQNCAFNVRNYTKNGQKRIICAMNNSGHTKKNRDRK